MEYIIQNQGVKVVEITFRNIPEKRALNGQVSDKKSQIIARFLQDYYSGNGKSKAFFTNMSYIEVKLGELYFNIPKANFERIGDILIDYCELET